MENFSNLLIYAPSKNFSPNELSLSFSVFKEHGFGGFIGDSASLPRVLEQGKNNDNTYCSLNFPYKGFHKDMIMNTIIYLESIQVVDCGGFCLSVDKHDMELGDWENIRLFINEAASITDKTLYISINPMWCKNPEDISRIFSVISNYDNINPIIDLRVSTDDYFEEKLRQFGSICKSATTKGITLYCPKLKKHSVAINPNEYGFDKVIISPAMAVAISREY